MYSRGIEFVRTKDGSGIAVLANNNFVIPAVGDDADRASIVVPGVLAVQCSSGDSSTIDGAVTANTTGSAGRLAMGIVTTVGTPTGCYIPRNQVAVSEAGVAALLPVRGNVFRCLEDGDGGNIADVDAYGYASFVISTPTSLSDADTFTPNPEPSYVIDSSSVSGGTSSNRMIKLLGPDPTVNADANSGRRAFLFEFVDAWTVAI